MYIEWLMCYVIREKMGGVRCTIREVLTMRDDIKVWLAQAKIDLKAARNSLSTKDYGWASVQAHQAAEKALKFRLLLRGEELLKIHDLVKLAKIINAPNEVLEDCAVLTPVYFEMRYPEGSELPSQKITKREVEQFIEVALRIIKWSEKS